ncbi:MAG TPA: tetratricopeptide repeat protein [Pirellulaceae bacterium]|nr:tetratricopeptide repeat protein [Pirellulaceae bacterium]
MRRDFGTCLLAAAAGLFSAGCASTDERGPLSWARLPSPSATIRNQPVSSSGPARSPARAAASDTRQSLWNRLAGGGKSAAAAKTAEHQQESLNLAILRGRNHERAGEWDKARALYEEARKQNPESPELAHRLGIVADAQRRHSEAEQLFQFALDRDRGNATVLSDLGYCYYLQGQLSKAESALLKATRLEPGNSRHWNNLALVIGHQGRYEEALECLRETGSEADAQYNLAFIYASQEKADQAKRCFQAALAADPLHRRAREALSSFEEYERLPVHLREMDDLAENGVRYVPYVEGSEKGGVQQAAAEEGVATSMTATRAARALHMESQGLRSRNMASQRSEDMAGQQSAAP